MSQSHAFHPIRKKAALISLGVGVAMLLGKWFAFAITGSTAILSDALESIVHVIATAFAFASILLSARPPDARYPYGYGKIGYFSAGFEGALIALASLAILYEGVHGLIFAKPLTRLDLGMAVIAVASVTNLWLGFHLIRLGKKTSSLILVADGQHVLTDCWTSFGVLLGVGLVLVTRWNWIDSVVAIGFGLNILWTGYHLVRESFVALMGRADPELLEQIVSALQAGRRDGWIDLHQLRATHSGDKTLVDFHLAVPPSWNVLRIHDCTDQIHDILRAALGEQTEVIVHFDPDRPGYDASAPFTVALATRIPGRDEEDLEHAAAHSLALAESAPI